VVESTGNVWLAKAHKQANSTFLEKKHHRQICDADGNPILPSDDETCKILMRMQLLLLLLLLL
jgi:hypothetical protein